MSSCGCGNTSTYCSFGQLAVDAKRAAPESKYVANLEELAYKILEDRVRAIATEHGYGLDDETPPPVGEEEEATLQ